MYAADRAVISTLGQALDLAAPHPPSSVGVVVDTFHVWWDPDLADQVARAGREGRIASYQVCDFNLPIAADPLLSRGMMGDGVIDFPSIGRYVAAAGYTGPVEVEIFNAEIWAADADEVLTTMKQRWLDLVWPSLAGSRLARRLPQTDDIALRVLEVGERAHPGNRGPGHDRGPAGGLDLLQGLVDRVDIDGDHRGRVGLVARHQRAVDRARRRSASSSARPPVWWSRRCSRRRRPWAW